MLIVKKFGGSSVADKEGIYRAARRCMEDYENGNQVVVVLSAMGKTTDRLIAMAHDINEKPPKREMDMLLAIGEQESVALMAMALYALGIPAVSLNAFQVAMHTSATYGSAKLKRIDADRIRHELEARRVVVVTGFQGVNRYDDVTTLGRGGSDTTAVALAAALHGDSCQIFTDVDGVYTADPRIVPNARKLSEVSYDEMLEFASLGAKVLHNRSVEMAKRYGVQLVVLSSVRRVPGTIIKEETRLERMLVSGVAADNDVARISVIGMKDEPGIAFKLFHLLAGCHINVDIIIQSVGRDETKDISFTVARTELEEAVALLEENRETLTARRVVFEERVAKISIIGAGMTGHPGVAAKMFEALYEADVNIKMIATSEIRITALIAEDDGDRAMRTVHDAFELAD